MGGLNQYQYVPNPTGWVDPLGLSSACPPPKKPGCEMPGGIGGAKVDEGEPTAPTPRAPPEGFGSEDKLIGHFEKHGAEFKAVSKDEYLNIAREVVTQGTRIEYQYKGEIRSGYLQLMGNNRKGEAKFAFVGTNQKMKLQHCTQKVEKSSGEQ